MQVDAIAHCLYGMDCDSLHAIKRKPEKWKQMIMEKDE